LEPWIDLSNKTVLEIGSGRGDTTHALVAMLARFPHTRLIITDVSSQFFPELQHKLEPAPVELSFVCTDACQLAEIDLASVDLVVCNYTLCAINAEPGKAALALRRFWEVLRPGGWVSIEEEFPIQSANTPQQEVWAEKWRILKAAAILTGGIPYSEFYPQTLANLCRLAGFATVTWEEDLAKYQGDDVLSFFQKRLSRLLPDLPNPALQTGFESWANALQARAQQLGGMEAPIYRLVAQKPWMDFP
jgi:ubiquinone/menaquinone biosynthesis C-methylase UbiE